MAWDVHTMVAVFMVVACAALLSIGDAAKLPSSIDRCSQKETDLNTCVKNAINKAIPTLKNGIPSLGLPSLDPLHIAKLHVGTKLSGDDTNFGLTFTDVDLSGALDMVVNVVKIDPKVPKIFMATVVKRNVLTGPYKVNGKVLRIKGEGTCNLTLTDMVTDVELLGEFITKGGHRYMKVKDLNMNMRPNRVYTHFDNLFNGDAVLGEAMNLFLNENWKDIYTEMKPAIERTFGQTFMEMSNKIFLQVPFNEIILP